MSLFITTGRRMTRQLQDALDGLGESRRTVAAAFDQVADSGTPLAPIYRAMALELRLAEMAERDTLDRLTAEHHDGLPDGPPLPRPSGPVWHADPDAAA
jgi:hypothetical protein